MTCRVGDPGAPSRCGLIPIAAFRSMFNAGGSQQFLEPVSGTDAPAGGGGGVLGLGSAHEIPFDIGVPIAGAMPASFTVSRGTWASLGSGVFECTAVGGAGVDVRAYTVRKNPDGYPWADLEVVSSDPLGVSGFTLLLRATVGASLSCYQLRILNSTTLQINRIDADVRTVLASGTVALAAGDEYRFVAQGARLRAFQNGAKVTDVTDINYTSGQVGMGTNGAGVRWDGFVVNQA